MVVETVVCFAAYENEGAEMCQTGGRSKKLGNQRDTYICDDVKNGYRRFLSVNELRQNIYHLCPVRYSIPTVFANNW